MDILVLGGGLMGPAAAAEALRDPATSSVTVADISQSSLEACMTRIAGEPRAERLRIEVADVSDARAIDRLLVRADAVISALPWAVARGVMEAAAQRGAPVIDLARVPDAEWASAQVRLSSAPSLVVLGCGVEPGLTEILARHLAEQLDEVDEVHIKCGGVPEHPTGPRYSGVEPVAFDGLGELEAWHEGFMPWLLDLKCMTNLKRGTQKTIRWPGYAAKATFLKDAGLLNAEPIEVDGVRMSPKRVLDAVLGPAVRMSDADRDITLLRVDVVGRSGERPRALRAEMVDRHDGVFTSMARTTAFTASIVARLAAAGRLARPSRSPATPEQVVVGAAFDELIAALAASGVRIEMREM
jgi:lysine 6-dehydrogenase